MKFPRVLPEDSTRSHDLHDVLKVRHSDRKALRHKKKAPDDLRYRVERRTRSEEVNDHRGQSQSDSCIRSEIDQLREMMQKEIEDLKNNYKAPSQVDFSEREEPLFT